MHTHHQQAEPEAAMDQARRNIKSSKGLGERSGDWESIGRPRRLEGGQMLVGLFLQECELRFQEKPEVMNHIVSAMRGHFGDARGSTGSDWVPLGQERPR